MKYYLAKTDPDTYSVDQFQKDSKTIWDGVHNYQAINAIKKMRPGDTVFIYHSMSDKAILAIGTIAGEPFENKNDTRFSWAVEIEFTRKTKPITLSEMKSADELKNFLLIKNPRLSTMEVPDEVAGWILERT